MLPRKGQESLRSLVKEGGGGVEKRQRLCGCDAMKGSLVFQAAVAVERGMVCDITI